MRSPEESERVFGCKHARLYPLIGKVVSTPHGEGVLSHVMGPNHCWVVFDKEERVEERGKWVNKNIPYMRALNWQKITKTDEDSDSQLNI